MKQQEERLEALITAAQSSPLTVDLLEFLSRGLDDKAFAIFIGNVSRLPQYMKSNEMLNFSRSRKAP